MNAVKAIPLKAGLLAAGAMLAMFALGPRANATVVRIHFHGTLAPLGPGASTPFSGYADLTLGTDPLASSTFPAPTHPPIPGGPGSPVPPGTGPSGTDRVDPPGAQAITHASGMFNGATIEGVVPIAATQVASATGEYTPGSMTRIATANFGPLTYDNLFYADGMPLTCLWYYPDGTTAAKYPFTGGFLDIYGVLFALSDNTYVDLWSNGIMPGLGLNYGAIRFAQDESGDFTVLDLEFNGVAASVPEPNFFWLLGAALLGLFAWRRRRESRKVHLAD